MENREYFFHKRNQMIEKNNEIESKAFNKENINFNESENISVDKNAE